MLHPRAWVQIPVRVTNRNKSELLRYKRCVRICFLFQLSILKNECAGITPAHSFGFALFVLLSTLHNPLHFLPCWSIQEYTAKNCGRELHIHNREFWLGLQQLKNLLQSIQVYCRATISIKKVSIKFSRVGLSSYDFIPQKSFHIIDYIISRITFLVKCCRILFYDNNMCMSLHTWLLILGLPRPHKKAKELFTNKTESTPWKGRAFPFFNRYFPIYFNSPVSISIRATTP